MTTVATPPVSPESDAAQLLFREARERRRRRWLLAGIVAVAFVLVATTAGFVASGGGRGAAPLSPSIPKASPQSVGPNHSVLPGTTEVVWFASGGLHLGNPSLGSDRVVAQVAAAATRLVSIGSRVYFFERGGPDVSALNGGNRIAELDAWSGRVHVLGAGINLSTTTDGRDLLVALDPIHLVELSPTGARLSPVWTVPSGYTLNTYASQHPLAAVAGGIAVESAALADFGCVCSGDLVSDQRHHPRRWTRHLRDRLVHTARGESQPARVDRWQRCRSGCQPVGDY